jgi:hypothetical protein
MLLQQVLVFIFVLLVSVLDVCDLLLLRLFVVGAFVFITALLLRGILLLPVCSVDLDQSIQLIVSIYMLGFHV